MIASTLKIFLPNHPVRVCIWRGPFRGARVVMNPRDSLRKIFGLYEHELNDWLERALRRVTRVVDVGANDGYFTFGCGAAFKRLGKSGEIIAIENQDQHIVKLRRSIEEQGQTNVTYQLVQAYAGREDKPGYVTLDSLGKPGQQTNALVKIDVGGRGGGRSGGRAEMDLSLELFCHRGAQGAVSPGVERDFRSARSYAVASEPASGAVCLAASSAS